MGGGQENSFINNEDGEGFEGFEVAVCLQILGIMSPLVAYALVLILQSQDCSFSSF